MMTCMELIMVLAIGLASIWSITTLEIYEQGICHYEGNIVRPYHKAFIYNLSHPITFKGVTISGDGFCLFSRGDLVIEPLSFIAYAQWIIMMKLWLIAMILGALVIWLYLRYKDSKSPYAYNLMDESETSTI